MTERWADIVSFGYWVERRRKALDLTRPELAEQVGCSPVTIKKIERDERQPSLQMAELLADHLYIPLAERNDFLSMARGESVPPLSSPLEAVPPPPFVQSQADPPEQEETPFVARENELATLAATLETARSGSGQITFVIGGAGRGKTMLVQEFARQALAADPDLLVVSGNCNAHSGLGDPYLPFREALTMLTGEVEAGVTGGLISRQRGQQLWQAMPLTIPALVEKAPDLINTFVPGSALQNRAAAFAPAGTPWLNRLNNLITTQPGDIKQERIFAQYTAVLKTVSARQPTLLMIEDLHWVDASSSSLLFYLSRQLHDSPLLIIGTYRPDEVALSRGEGQHPMATIVGELKRQHGDIWLDLAQVSDGRHFVDAFLDTQPNRLDEGFRQALFAHTGGHALFTVELLREMQERDDLRQDETGCWVAGETLDWETLPAKVEGVIEQRINRLEEALRMVLTIASVEGESFTAEVVARIQALDERQLVQRLSRELDKQYRLVTAQALEWLGKQRLSFYRFRHQLFQHYLYYSLDPMERVYLHEAVGQVLEALYGEQTEQVAVQLARHFQQAGLTEKAATYLLQAGKRASQLSANEEAITHLTKGLAFLEIVPAGPERSRQELEFQITLGNSLIATRGYAAPEVGQTYNRARELSRQIEDTAQRFAVLQGLHGYYLVRAEFQTALELGEQLLGLAQNMQEPYLLTEAHRVLGATHWFLDEYIPALEHLEQGLAFYDRQQHHSYVLLYGQDPGVACLAYQGWILWQLGYPDQALKKSYEAITLARELSHPYSLAYALCYAAWVHQFRREAQAVRDLTEEAINLSTEQGFPIWMAFGTTMRGSALAEQGDPEEGIARISQGLATWRSMEAELATPRMLNLLAESYERIGQIEKGLEVLAEALAEVSKTGEGYWEADLYRLQGELLLKAAEAGRGVARAGASEDDESPEACFQKAIEIARRQGAKSLELRATVSLCRLWQRQGKREEAHQMLAEIYGWFTEGFDTVDLQEARALLETLAKA